MASREAALFRRAKEDLSSFAFFGVRRHPSLFYRHRELPSVAAVGLTTTPYPLRRETPQEPTAFL